MTIDSRRISFVDKAISFEEESMKFYQDVAEHMKTGGHTNAWQIALTLRDEEARHKRMLQNLGAQDLTFLQDKAESMGAYSLEGVAKLSFPLKDRKVEEILKEALDREQKSVEVYTQLMEAADSDDLREFFEAMRKEETRHREMVQEEIDRLHSYSGHQ